jgi:hypothetical protein
VGGIALKVAIASTTVAMFGIPMCNGVGAIVHGKNPSHFWGDVPGFHSYGPWDPGRLQKFAGVRRQPCKTGGPS